MIRFGFSISYVPGTRQCTANVLSRFPLHEINDNIPDMNIFALIAKSLPIRDVIIDKIHTVITSNRALQMVINHCQIGWPEISSLPPDAQQFAHSRERLTVCDSLLMYGTRFIMPFSLRTKMLDALHDVHQGIVKSRERARSSVRWSKIGKDIECMVTSCYTCTNYRT